MNTTKTSRMSKEEALAEVKSFKENCRFYADGTPLLPDWDEHDDKMFELFWERNVEGRDDFVRVVDCSFADCTHFFFEYKDRIVDFYLEEPNQTDIWEHVYIFKREY